LGHIPQENRAESAIVVNVGPRYAPDQAGRTGLESAFDRNVAAATGTLTGRTRLFCRMSPVAAFSSAGAAD
jgi:hypothetical protein